MANSCKARNINVLAEAFAERRYNFNTANQQLSLIKRTHRFASINDCEEAVKQVKEIISGQINAFIDESDTLRPVAIKAETVCIHSDSPISLQLARELKNV